VAKSRVVSRICVASQDLSTYKDNKFITEYALILHRCLSSNQNESWWNTMWFSANHCANTM